MGKFNTTATRTLVQSPIATEANASTRTYNSAPGHTRDTKSELFLLAVSNLVGEKTFYEAADTRDNRYVQLIHAATEQDPEWAANFLRWLRLEGNMRSASLVGAAEYARVATKLQITGSRAVVNSVLQRADEPGEMLAYWTSTHGRAIPKPVKRGIADAVQRLYNERSLLKYDSDAKGFRFADVLALTHALPSGSGWQSALFEHAIDRRYNRAENISDNLPMLRAREALMAVPVEQRRAHLIPAEFAAAGMTWEAVAGWLQGPMDKAAWEAVIPSMGYMALLRNLRNFDEAGISRAVEGEVLARLADEDQVARSKQFPFRFHAAYKNVGSLNWARTLEQALEYSLRNVPVLRGRTLVLVDQSPSMFPREQWPQYTGTWAAPTDSKSTTVTNAEKAALFGSAVALRAESADLIGYGSTNYPVPFRKGDSVLRTMEKFRMNDGTDTPRAIAENYRDHDRVIIVTDEQTSYSNHGTVDERLPVGKPCYTWNLEGYRAGHGRSGSKDRHTFGGLTDAAFRLIPLLESGRDGSWPWSDRG